MESPPPADWNLKKFTNGSQFIRGEATDGIASDSSCSLWLLSHGYLSWNGRRNAGDARCSTEELLPFPRLQLLFALPQAPWEPWLPTRMNQRNEYVGPGSASVRASRWAKRGYSGGPALGGRWRAAASTSYLYDRQGRTWCSRYRTAALRSSSLLIHWGSGAGL